MKTDLIIDAIQLLRPNSEFAIFGGDFENIEWHNLEGAPPTKGELIAAIDQVKANQILEVEQKAAEKSALLVKLGITADEARLLLS
jgi:hypothetical protein